VRSPENGKHFIGLGRLVDVRGRSNIVDARKAGAGRIENGRSVIFNAKQWKFPVVADNSVARERNVEGAKTDVQQRQGGIPVGVSDSGKREHKAIEWTAFKQKGWEVIHKAETRSYV